MTNQNMHGQITLSWIDNMDTWKSLEWNGKPAYFNYTTTQWQHLLNKFIFPRVLKKLSKSIVLILNWQDLKFCLCLREVNPPPHPYHVHNRACNNEQTHKVSYKMPQNYKMWNNLDEKTINKHPQQAADWSKKRIKIMVDNNQCYPLDNSLVPSLSQAHNLND